MTHDLVEEYISVKLFQTFFIYLNVLRQTKTTTIALHRPFMQSSSMPLVFKTESNVSHVTFIK